MNAAAPRRTRLPSPFFGPYFGRPFGRPFGHLFSAVLGAPALSLRVVLAGLAAGLLLAGCGGFGDDRSKAHVRLVNASDAYAGLDFNVEGSLRQGNVAYAQSGSYVDIDPDNTDSTISATSSPTALLTFTPALAKNRHYTLLAFGGAGTLRQLLIDENVAEPSNNRTSLRVINAAPDAGNVDVYITAAADDIQAAVPARAGAAYGELSPGIDLASGTWRVRVAAAGSKTDLRLDLSSVAFGNRQALTLVLAPSRGGALVNAILLVQEGGLTRLDTMHARVRVMAGVTGSGSVTASIGGATVLNGVGAPAASLYALVAAGAPAVTLSVNGTPVTAPGTTLVAGADYTLLVYAALASPLTAWLEDDSKLPRVTGKARIRLVNGTAIAALAAMTVDGLPVAGNLAAGAAGTPVEVTAKQAAVVRVTAVGVATPLYDASNELLAGELYSVLVVGETGSTTALLVNDR